MANFAGTRVQGEFDANPVLPPLTIGHAVINTLPVRYTEAGFCFLHQTVKFSSFEAIDWNFAGHGKLWTYNLNYFEYLRQPGLPPATGEQLIGAWISAATTHKDGWEPYPISLRLVNWLQFYRSTGRAVPARVHNTILLQYHALWQKLEYHLGGNHLLENAIALSLTARYLRDARGIARADRLLRAELKEQYLPSGAHFELSVMYHLILLWRQLDLYSWLRQLEGWDDHWEVKPPNELLPELRTSLKRQLAWANYLITPDGRYPHFNDSTNGIAPDWAAVKAYANVLGLSRSSDASLPLTQSGQSSSDVSVKGASSSDISAQGQPLPDTSNKFSAGAAGRKDASDERVPRLIHRTVALPPHRSSAAPVQLNLWIDAAQIGPSYIPGHAHADSLTFVLHANGVPVVVDPSISTYEKNARRSWERSTAAHNTVEVDGKNSSDVWGGFRVGQRATTALITDTTEQLTVEHDGYGKTRHRRTFSFGDEGLTVMDQLRGPATGGVARLHFAPGLSPSLEGTTLRVAGLYFTFAGATSCELFAYRCAQGFNLLEDGVGVRLSFTKELVTTIGASE